MLPFGSISRAKLFINYVVFTISLCSSIAQRNETIVHTRLANSSVEPSPSSCICVPYYYCDSENTIITSGEGFIDIRNSRTNLVMGSACEDDLEICCRLPEAATNASRCGRRRTNSNSLPRLDKDAAEDGEFPWMVTIFRTEFMQQGNETTKKRVYQCQGTLINERVVLTAAQCVKESENKTDLLIRAGQTDTMTTNEEFVYQEHDVQDVIIPKNYNPIRLRGNIALLVLKKSVTFNRRVDVACLVDQADDIDKDKCLLIGWDKFVSAEEAQFQRSQVNLLKRRLEPYVSRDVCTSILRLTPLGRRFTLPNCSICAGGPLGNNFCSREIGAPLACPLKSEPSRYVQVGIASWCINAGNLKTPSIFTSVLDALNWIDDQIRKLHFDTSMYRATRG